MDKVVVGFDASEQARDALMFADMLRAAGDGQLIVAAVDEVKPYLGDAIHWQKLRQEYFEEMFEGAAGELGRSNFTRRTSAESVPRALEEIAVAEGADVIVVGSTHRGQIGRAVPGSVGVGSCMGHRARSRSLLAATTSANIRRWRRSASATTESRSRTRLSLRPLR